jgi:hypothetical protein
MTANAKRIGVTYFSQTYLQAFLQSQETEKPGFQARLFRHIRTE